MTDWKAVGQRVRDARRNAGMTGAQLGAAAGIGDAGRVSTLESGTKPLTEENLAKVAEVLAVSLPWLRYGVATQEDAGRIRTEGYAVGWRSALVEIERAAQRLRSAHPGSAFPDVLGEPRQDQPIDIHPDELTPPDDGRDEDAESA